MWRSLGKCFNGGGDGTMAIFLLRCSHIPGGTEIMNERIICNEP